MSGKDSNQKPRIMLSISGHGFGHLSQASSVINALATVTKDFAVEVRSPLSKSVIKDWVTAPFEYTQAEDDIGMCMANALVVDKAASLNAYRRLHSQWDAKVKTLGQSLQKKGVSLVLADIAYLPLAASQSVGIPSVAMCSLNWADILTCYFPDQKKWIATARSAYQNADVFVVPEPGMRMPWLANQHRVGPIGRKGRNYRKAVTDHIGYSEDGYLVLLGMGGIQHSLHLTRWPSELHGKPVHYMVSESHRDQRPDSSVVSDLPFGYADLMASCDLVVTKPGYGMFVEAAGAGIPVLFTRRGQWPDVPSLIGWLQAVGRAAQVSDEQLDKGHLSEAMEELLSEGRYPGVELTGAGEAARIVADFLI